MQISNNHFSSTTAAQIDQLTKTIEAAPKVNCEGKEYSYTQTVRAIHDMTLCLFKKIADSAQKAGFKDVNLLEAWPKGLCENFVCATKDETGNVTEVILSYNTQYKFYQNGGGKTLDNESSAYAAHREAHEELNFPVNARDQMRRITIESESSEPVFHFVKGVHVGFVTPEQANQLKTGDDIADSKLVRLPTDEFVRITNEDKTPYDHGFDRKWISQYIQAMNRKENLLSDMHYKVREITAEDSAIATKAREWMSKIHVSKGELDMLEKLIVEFVAKMEFPEAKAEGNWRTKPNRGAVQASAQKLVNTLVNRLLPAWTYPTKKGEQTACQIKVQDAVGFFLNGEPLPSFLTIPQMVSVQDEKAKRFHMLDLSNLGHWRNLITLNA